MRRNIPPQQLRQTIEAFNAYAANRDPDPFGRTGDEQPLDGDRWMLLGPAKAYFTTTEGGLAVNHELQALTATGDVIPGLYAVGQTGLGGQILWGHGLHIAWAITSGRLAGRNAAQETRVTRGDNGGEPL
jgi:succinate dehydrogenase/fumarate reductase flavoprotein subunit